MQKTWLVSLNTFTKNIYFEHFYFIFELVTLNNFFFKLNFNCLSYYIFKFKNIFFLNTSISAKRLFRADLLVSFDLTSSTKFFKTPDSNFLINKPTSQYFKFYNLFFLFNYSIYNSFFYMNYKYNFFFVKNIKKDIIIININKFLFRWKDAYSFIFNIYYYDFKPLYFGTYFFKNEILSLNWKENCLNPSLWKFNYSFFIFKTNKFNVKNDFFFLKLAAVNLDFTIITDPLFHFKNIYYLNRNKFFILSLIDINLDPWLVNYPIPVVYNSNLIQFFFIKILLLLNKTSNFYKYQIIKNKWLINNNLKFLN